MLIVNSQLSAINVNPTLHSWHLKETINDLDIYFFSKLNYFFSTTKKCRRLPEMLLRGLNN